MKLSDNTVDTRIPNHALPHSLTVGPLFAKRVLHSHVETCMSRQKGNRSINLSPQSPLPTSDVTSYGPQRTTAVALSLLPLMSLD